MPVRKVSNRGRNIIGKFPSIKMKRMITFESLLERDFIYLLDYAPEVEWYEEQPLTIEYEHDNKILHYTPDFHLVKSGQNILVECKPEKFVDRLETQRKTTVAYNWCTHREWKFCVVTDHQVRRGFCLENVKMLTRYARQKVDTNIQGKICTLLDNRQRQMSIDSIAETIFSGDRATIAPIIMHMVFHHVLWAPINNEPISGKTLISLPLQSGRGGEVCMQSDFQVV